MPKNGHILAPKNRNVLFRMTRSFKAALIALGGILVIGTVVIIMNGRPVSKMTYTTTDTSTATDEDNRTDDVDDAEETTTDDTSTAVDTTTTTDTTATDTTTKPATTSDTYTMADVATHSVASNCWSVVNGSVYDLTTWVTRHPGGSGAIINMCGKDGSNAFNRQHGSFPAAQSALGLLKIGKLTS